MINFNQTPYFGGVSVKTWFFADGIDFEIENEDGLLLKAFTVNFDRDYSIEDHTESVLEAIEESRNA